MLHAGHSGVLKHPRYNVYSITTLWTSKAPLPVSNLSHDSLTKRSCALAQLAWNAFTPRPGRISYPSIGSHKLNKSSMEFVGGLSPCCARFGNLYFYVVPVTVTRTHIHGDACATRRRSVFFFFFRTTLSRPTWHFVHSALLLPIERASSPKELLEQINHSRLLVLTRRRMQRRQRRDRVRHWYNELLTFYQKQVVGIWWKIQLMSYSFCCLCEGEKKCSPTLLWNLAINSIFLKRARVHVHPFRKL